MASSVNTYPGRFGSILPAGEKASKPQTAHTVQAAAESGSAVQEGLHGVKDLVSLSEGVAKHGDQLNDGSKFSAASQKTLPVLSHAGSALSGITGAMSLYDAGDSFLSGAGSLIDGDGAAAQEHLIDGTLHGLKGLSGVAGTGYSLSKVGSALTDAGRLPSIAGAAGTAGKVLSKAALPLGLAASGFEFISGIHDYYNGNEERGKQKMVSGTCDAVTAAALAASGTVVGAPIALGVAAGAQAVKYTYIYKDEIADAAVKAYDTVSSGAQALKDTFVEGAAGAYDCASQIGKTAGNAAGKVGEAGKEAAGDVAAAALKGGAGIAGAVVSGAQRTASAASESGGKIGRTALDGGRNIGRAALESGLEAGNTLLESGAKIGGAGYDLGRDTAGITRQQAALVGKVLSSGSENIREALDSEGILGAGRETLKTAAATGGALAKGAAEIGATAASGMLNLGGAVIDGAVDTGKAVAKGVLKTGGEIVNAGLDTGKSMVEGAINVGGEIIGSAAQIGGKMLDGAAGVASAAAKGIKNVGGAVYDGIGEVGSSVAGAAGRAGNFLSEKAGAVADALCFWR